jgi:hypothetical protein
MLQKYEAAYAEVYVPDFMPLDTKHHIVEAFTQAEGAGGPGAIAGFLGFRPWLAKVNRTRHVREGTVRLRFAAAGARPQKLAALKLTTEVPKGTSVTARLRVRTPAGKWSAWKPRAAIADLPAGTEAEAEILLHTDDAYLTPRVTAIQPSWQ